MADSDDQSISNSDLDTEISRRKFLKKAAYVPPAILGVMTTSKPAYAATCNPHACGPDCNPNADCGPDNSCGPDGCPPDTPGCGPEGCPPNY